MRRIFQAIPVGRLAHRQEITSFHLEDYIDDVREIVLQSRYRSYPILDSQERVVDDSTPVLSLVRRDRRYGTLSQVLVRDRWSGRVETVSNPDFQKAGGQARRVITMPTRSSYKAMRYSGQFQLDKSAGELERVDSVLILCQGEPLGELGGVSLAMPLAPDLSLDPALEQAEPSASP